jgi:hypothetical protein
LARNSDRKKSSTRRLESGFLTLWPRLRCLLRGRLFGVPAGVLVGSAMAYTGGRVTSGVRLGCAVASGVDDGTSTAIAADTGNLCGSADQFSCVGCFGRNSAIPKATATASEIIATPIAQRARR